MSEGAGHDPPTAAAFLRGLNACFPGWGDEASFAWCFHRSAGAGAADLLTVDFDGEAVAGLAIVYRRARSPEAGEHLIGGLSGAWTLPAHRGRGHFSRLLGRARQVALARGAEILVAFASADRRSVEPLRAASDRVIDAAILTANSPPRDAPAAPLARMSREEAIAAFSARDHPRGSAHIVHSADTWAGQLLDRPGNMSAWQFADGATAVVEQQGIIARLLDLSVADPFEFGARASSIAATVAAMGSRLVVYSVEPAVIERLVGAGFAATPCHMFLINLGNGGLVEAPWFIANGDRV